MVPLVGRRIVVNILMVVVLPAPFGPRKAKISPWRTSKEMPFTAVTEAKVFLRLFTLIMYCQNPDSLLESLSSCACHQWQLNGIAIRLCGLMPQHGHKLALEPVRLSTAHALLVSYEVETHLPIERVGNQA